MSEPGGGWERAADRVAERVSRGEPSTQSDAGARYPSADDRRPRVPAGLERRLDRRAGRGQPLPVEARTFFETHMGFGFSGVRVHTDSAAWEMSRELGARAFALGRDIHFGAGEYNPGSSGGRRLLAHELTHVIQQTSGPGGGRAPVGARVGEGAASGVIQRTTLSEIHQNQRLALRIRTQLPTLSPQQVDQFFERLSNGRWGMSISAPGGATVRLGPNVPPVLETPLTTVAGHLRRVSITQSGQTEPLLDPNTVVTARMDLTAHGGPAGLFRFTWFGASSNGRGGTLLIESVSAIGGPPGGPLQLATHDPSAGGAAGTISASGHTFTLEGSRGSWTPHRVASVQEALSLIPEAALSRAAGLRFEVRSGGLGTGVGSRDEGGHYDPATDTVVLFPVIWGEGGRSASPFSGGHQTTFFNPVQVVAHEIAHAIDRRVTHQAAERFRQSAQTPADVRQVEAVRGVSGGRIEVSQGSFGFSDALSDTRTSAFRRAYLQDGASVAGGNDPRIVGAVTLYGATEWQEVFAEAFSLYITDPQALEQVRPHVFRFFVSEFPRQQSTVFLRMSSDRTPAQIVQDHDLSRQGIDEDALRRLNPEIGSASTVSDGTVIWLRAREVSARATGFEAIARRYFGSRYHWPRLWGFNPDIEDPTSIESSTRIHLQSKDDRDRFGEVILD